MKCFVSFVLFFLCKGERIGLRCQLLYDLLLQSDQACQSTFLSLDIKTFDNRATTDAEEEEGAAWYAVPTNYAAWDVSLSLD